MIKTNEVAEQLIDLGAASVETKGGSKIPALDNFVAGLRDNSTGLSND